MRQDLDVIETLPQFSWSGKFYSVMKGLISCLESMRKCCVGFVIEKGFSGQGIEHVAELTCFLFPASSAREWLQKSCSTKTATRRRRRSPRRRCKPSVSSLVFVSFATSLFQLFSAIPFARLRWPLSGPPRPPPGPHSRLRTKRRRRKRNPSCHIHPSSFCLPPIRK